MHVLYSMNVCTALVFLERFGSELTVAQIIFPFCIMKPLLKALQLAGKAVMMKQKVI